MLQGLSRVLEIVYESGALTTTSDMKPEIIANAYTAILGMIPEEENDKTEHNPGEHTPASGFNRCRFTILKNFKGGK